MRKAILCLGLAGGFALVGWDNTLCGQLVNVGDHRLFAHYTGQASDMTVILENGAGADLDTWKAVQSKVEGFSRVCSYDRAGVGPSTGMTFRWIWLAVPNMES